MFDTEGDSGVNYLSPIEGMAHIKNHTPQGDGGIDTIDFHAVVGDKEEVLDFKDKYFKLIPTWHFLKQLTREALMKSLVV
jgi:hypothetical protein